MNQIINLQQLKDNPTLARVVIKRPLDHSAKMVSRAYTILMDQLVTKCKFQAATRLKRWNNYLDEI